MSSFHEVSRRAGFFLLLTLAACGGGGGGGAGGGGGLPTPGPLAAEQPASNFENTADFDPCILASDDNTYCNYGLGQIGAADVYAMGAYGDGVVVAVIDTGIDTAHVELDSKISSDSTDIAAPGTPLDDEIGHGTMVAGVIAAERNDIGTHGVAFGSTILALRTESRDLDGTSTGTFTVADLTAAISYAAGKAHVINMSLGATGSQLGDAFGEAAEQVAFERALIDAMAANAIIVVATGNEGATEATLPAAYAGDTTVNASGQMVAVGAVNNAADALASFSNHCGLAMNYCLVAPGDGLWTTYPGDFLTYTGGTSFSAPYVAGSAALLIQLWPTLLPSEVVQILLTTATDMGVAGVDTVYGHGLLNLSAAITPAGALEVPLTPLAGGDGVTLDGTALTLGPAFGDALTNSSLLSRTFALDDYDRNYGVDLNDFVTRSSRGFGLAALLGGGAVETVDAELPNGMKIAMGVSDGEETGSTADWSGMAAGDGEEQQLHGMSLEIESGLGASLRFGYDVTPEQQMAGLAASAPAGLFWMPGDLLGAQHGLVDAGTGVSLSRQLDPSSILSIGWVDQTDDADALEPDAKIGEITLAHRFGNGAIGYAGFSTVDEQGGFLGSSGAGGFAVAGADTQFYSLGGRYPMVAGLELIGNYTLGEADMRADGTSLLGEWSEIRAEAFGVGLVKNGVLGRHDRIGLLAGQPLRVSSGEATVTAPVDYLIDKTVVQDSERVSMTPSGREIDLQIAYDAPLGGNAAVSGWVMMQLEPGHVAEADPVYGVGLRFSAGF
jgi:hypothetical protein